MRIVADLGPSWGTWPLNKDGTVVGWPRGEFYQVASEHSAEIEKTKGLRVLARAPRGDLFRRWVP